MKLNWKYRLGGRAYKTALAVFLTAVFSLVFHRNSSFYGCIAAVICMQRSKEETQKQGRQRLEGTLAGGVLGWGFLEIAVRIPHYQDYIFALIAPLGVLLVIYLMNVLNRLPSITIGCVVFLSIVVNFNRTLQQIPWYVFDRVLDTAIGIAMATLVNWIPMKEHHD